MQSTRVQALQGCEGIVSPLGPKAWLSGRQETLSPPKEDPYILYLYPSLAWCWRLLQGTCFSEGITNTFIYLEPDMLPEVEKSASMSIPNPRATVPCLPA